MTVFIKISALWPKYGIKRANTNGTKLTPGYNLWTVQELVENSNTKYSEVSAAGGIFMINVNFDCNFDRDPEECIPTFQFSRVDSDSALTKGYNFRYAHYYWLEQNSTWSPVPGRTQYRDLFKAYGTRFLILIGGKGHKFSPVPLFVNLGSGLALLSIATIISDILVLYVLPKKKLYQKVKFEDAEASMFNEESSPLIQSGMKE